MSDQSTLNVNLNEDQRGTGTIYCLGMTFETDEERRRYFTQKLREKLRDPEFRAIEGFPIGSDEDILALSDPPYYTACPNPWIADFINEWESEKPEKPADFKYHREPFAADVREGKNDPIYNAHSYHTKVPHKAIMRYILHYTEPGDIVFDGFCGTGMTGVAAQMCGNRETVESLGYQVKPDDTIIQQETGEDGKIRWAPFSKLGARRTLLNDLSPAATFIAYNFNTPVDVKAFEKEAKRILKEIEEECSWMYETLHSDGKSKGKINYTVWSDIFVCPECASHLDAWHLYYNGKPGPVNKTLTCWHCNSEMTRAKLDRVLITDFDQISKTTLSSVMQIPVLINYSVGKKRFEKIPDSKDIENIEMSRVANIGLNYPIDLIMFKGKNWGDTWRAGIHKGTERVDQFYNRRALYVLSHYLNRSSDRFRSQLQFLLGSVLPKLTKMNRYMPQHGSRALVGPMANTLYLPPLCIENNVCDQFEFQLKKIKQALSTVQGGLVSTQGSQSLKLSSETMDYVFVDPPFGANIMYSELSFIREAWLKVFTNNSSEVIENASQNKSLDVYRSLMVECFAEIYRLLKPGRWMTVEFSNTNASVWNSIQTALNEAGFIVANVSALDKSRGGLQSMIGTTAVKQDLIISAYKPNGGFENRFSKEAATEEGVWDFLRTHLEYLPVAKYHGALLQIIPERDPRILFDQMVAYYVRKGYPVPISSQEFQIGLGHRFIERDGMYFLPEQAAEYDRKKLTSGQLIQTKLFVSDEASAIQWLRQLLKEKPQTFQDINPVFMPKYDGWNKNEQQLDLRELLNQNFLKYDGSGEVPSQIHSYLSTNWQEMRNRPKDDPVLMAKSNDRWYVPDPNKSGDLDKLRERSLLKEFEEYRQAKKKLRVFRMEAVRAGFKKAWQEKDYSTIIKVAEIIPGKVLEEDPKLLMWYDQAVTRVGGE